MSAGLVFNAVNKGKLLLTSPGPNIIRHAQIVWKHEDLQRKSPSLTTAQVSDRIAGFFNHGADDNQGYLRRTFNNLDDPKARKGGAALLSISEDDAGPSIRAPEPRKKSAARKQPAPKPAPEQPAPKPTPEKKEKPAQ